MARKPHFRHESLLGFVEAMELTPEEKTEAKRRAEWLTAQTDLTFCCEVQIAFVFGVPVSPSIVRLVKPKTRQALPGLQRGLRSILDGHELPNVLRNGNPRSHVLSDRAALCLLMRVYNIVHGLVPSADAMRNLDEWCNIADHFGLWQLRYLLEDTAFQYGEAENYDLLCSLIEKKQASFRPLVSDITAILQHYFQRENIPARISARSKNVYGIYRKMHIKGKSINHINDLFGLRITTAKTADCYRILDILHRLWPPFLEDFRDFIRAPKQNGYQSIHTTVACLNGTSVEFQIRTEKMHHVALYGLASHAAYKAMTRS